MGQTNGFELSVRADTNSRTLRVYDATEGAAEIVCDGDRLTFAVAGGSDQNRFTIDGATGELKFRAAPDFEAPAYQGGVFGQVKLSDYQGKWVVLCFYPGDFTFV